MFRQISNTAELIQSIDSDVGLFRPYRQHLTIVEHSDHWFDKTAPIFTLRDEALISEHYHQFEKKMRKLRVFLLFSTLSQVNYYNRSKAKTQIRPSIALFARQQRKR